MPSMPPCHHSAVAVARVEPVALGVVGALAVQFGQLGVVELLQVAEAAMRSITQPPGVMTSQPVVLPAARSGWICAEEVGVVVDGLVVVDVDAGLGGERVDARVLGRVGRSPRRCRCTPASCATRSVARRRGAAGASSAASRPGSVIRAAQRRRRRRPAAPQEGPARDRGRCRRSALDGDARSGCGSQVRHQVSSFFGGVGIAGVVLGAVR